MHYFKLQNLEFKHMIDDMATLKFYKHEKYMKVM